MGKDQSVFKILTLVQLKRILTDYNKKIRKKEYKGIASMKKSDVIAELNKMYSWRHQDKKNKVSFLRKGKQHSFVLGIRGVLEANQDAEERMKKKKDRKKAISKVLLKKRIEQGKEKEATSSELKLKALQSKLKKDKEKQDEIMKSEKSKAKARLQARLKKKKEKKKEVNKVRMRKRKKKLEEIKKYTSK